MFLKTIGPRVIIFVLVSIVAIIPVVGIVVPPLTDLAQHIYVNKLLWESIAGVSHLDTELNAYIGYRLPSVLIVILISICKLFGVSLVYLPKLAVISLIVFQTAVVGAVVTAEQRRKDVASWAFSAALCLPAVAAMYSAAFYIGFIGFTMGVTLLVASIYFGERFLLFGGKKNGLFVFLLVLLAYTAHPFATFFWLLWCLCRAIASCVTWNILSEWKRFICLGLLFLPVAVYHFVATSAGGLSSSTESMSKESLMVPWSFWYESRFWPFVSGIYVKADDTAGATLYAAAALLLIGFSVFLTFFSSAFPQLRRAAVAVVLFILLGSWINEKFIPVPPNSWLAYDYRWATAAYVIGLTFVAIVFIRFLQTAERTKLYTVLLAAVAIFASVVSLNHLLEVRKAFARFDEPGRVVLNEIFTHQRPSLATLPRNKWTLDMNFVRHYVCLVESDCHLTGSTFEQWSGVLFPIKIKSPKPVFPTGEVALDATIEPSNAFLGGQGFGAAHFIRPRGIGADSVGNIYVADTGAARVQKFDSAGNFVRAFGSYGELAGNLITPVGVAVDDRGGVYVADSSRNAIVLFNKDGSAAREWIGSQFGWASPRDVAIVGRELFVLDQGQGQVVKVDLTTDEIKKWGSMGKGDGQFGRPTGFAVGGGFVFVADHGNNRLHLFTTDGQFVRGWAVKGWDNYIWNVPDVAFDDSAKRLYLTNAWKKDVLVYDLEGNELPPIKADTRYSDENLSSLAISSVAGRARLYILNIGSDYADNLGDPNVTFIDF